MANAFVELTKQIYQQNKDKGMTYKQAIKKAQQEYKSAKPATSKLDHKGKTDRKKLIKEFRTLKADLEKIIKDKVSVPNMTWQRFTELKQLLKSNSPNSVYTKSYDSIKKRLGNLLTKESQVVDTPKAKASNNQEALSQADVDEVIKMVESELAAVYNSDKVKELMVEPVTYKQGKQSITISREQDILRQAQNLAIVGNKQDALKKFAVAIAKPLISTKLKKETLKVLDEIADNITQVGFSVEDSKDTIKAESKKQQKAIEDASKATKKASGGQTGQIIKKLDEAIKANKDYEPILQQLQQNTSKEQLQELMEKYISKGASSYDAFSNEQLKDEVKRRSLIPEGERFKAVGGTSNKNLIKLLREDDAKQGAFSSGAQPPTAGNTEPIEEFTPPDVFEDDTDALKYSGEGLVKMLGSRANTKRKTILDEDKIYRDATNQSYIKDRKTMIDGYDYEPKPSNDELAVYENPNTKEIVVAVRGSATPEDWLYTDIMLATKDLKNSPRYERNLQVVKDLMAQNPDSKIVLTGHSLGGGIAIQMSKDLGLKSVVFNAATTVGQKKDESLPIRHYSVHNDVVSALGVNKYGKPEDDILIEKGDKNAYNAHSMSNFDDDAPDPAIEESGIEMTNLAANEGGAFSFPSLGSNRDIHGCIPSAGYVYNTSTKSCERPFEFPSLK